MWLAGSVINLNSFKVSSEQVIDEVDEGPTVPVIYEDRYDSEGESEALETDQESEDGEQSDEAFDGVSDIERNDDMMSD